MPWYVGNDLVDLTEKENEDRPKNVRFVNRVLTEKERRLLNESADKVTTFALLWSGKEAAYKVLKKIDSSIFFSHSQFVVTIKKCQTGGHEGHQRWGQCVSGNCNRLHVSQSFGAKIPRHLDRV